MEQEILGLLKSNKETLDRRTIMRVEADYNDFIDKRIPNRFLATLRKHNSSDIFKKYPFSHEPPKINYFPVPIDFAELISGYDYMMREQQ